MARRTSIVAWFAVVAVVMTPPPLNEAHAQVPSLDQIYEFGRQNEQTAKQSQTASLRFTPDPARRKATYAKAVAEAKKTNPALAEIYGALSTQVDLYAVINDYLTPYGMRADDLGDVLALSWFSAYQVANGGKTDDPTKAELTAIRAQLGAVSVNLGTLSNADKQAMADILMLDMAAQQGALEAAKESNAKLVPQLAKTFAEVNSQVFNVDFAQLILGPKGFYPKEQVKPAKSSTNELASNATRLHPKPVPFTSEHSEKILGVRYKSDLIFMAGGPAGYLHRTETTAVLFKDGTVCWNCLPEYVEDPSLREYRSKNPDNMGKWVKKGTTYYITYPDTQGEPSEIGADELIGPAPKGTVFNGVFETSGGMTMGGVDNYTMTSWSEDLRLTRDGRFSWAKGSTVLGQGGGVGIAGSRSSPAVSGKYSIDGYTIRLTFDDGRVVTKSLVAFPNETEFLVIDGSGYWIPSD